MANNRYLSCLEVNSEWLKEALEWYQENENAKESFPNLRTWCLKKSEEFENSQKAKNI